MLHLRNTGYQIFAVELYNEDVRTLVERKRQHSYFDDHWANVQVRDVVARDEGEALALIAERFPPEDGFVVEHVALMRY
ncbi:MAG: hypothetical protein U1E66_02475 [Rhodospirillales bacterium]